VPSISNVAHSHTTINSTILKWSFFAFSVSVASRKLCKKNCSFRCVSLPRLQCECEWERELFIFFSDENQRHVFWCVQNVRIEEETRKHLLEYERRVSKARQARKKQSCLSTKTSICKHHHKILFIEVKRASYRKIIVKRKNTVKINVQRINHSSYLLNIIIPKLFSLASTPHFVRSPARARN
jgi:hypothetical protein